MQVKKLAVRFALGLLLVLGVTVVALLSYRAYLQHRVREKTRITSPNGIESLQKIELGGVEQWILIRGWDMSNPVLLHLHGGPGAADIAITRHFDTELVKHFVMVHWDQRGAGKSFSPDIPPQSMTREQFISDTRDLTEFLKRRFNAPKIYLVGHSWGSELGLLVAARYPEHYYAFVGVGQVVDDDQSETVSYNFVLNKARESGNEAALRELEEIGPPPYDTHDELLTQRRWLERFGGVSRTPMPMRDLILLGLGSPEYSLIDGLNFFRGQSFTAKHMWGGVEQTDFFKEVPRIDVPVYFFEGRYDYNTPFEVAEKYYEQLEAPKGKRLVWFENSGHMIPYESPDEYSKQLIKVLEETYRLPEGENQ
ncbi:MAG: alpha/beta hydrolase [Candidatus Abyssubacteria bacterium]